MTIKKTRGQASGFKVAGTIVSEVIHLTHKGLIYKYHANVCFFIYPIVNITIISGLQYDHTSL
jgi:hypothetical protein